MTDRLGEFARSYWMPMAGVLCFAFALGGNAWQIGSVADGNRLILTKLDRLSDQVVISQVSVAEVRAREQANRESISELQERFRAIGLRR